MRRPHQAPVGRKREAADVFDAEEYAMLELPAFVRRVVIPILYFVERVVGKHEKYRNAPEPMTKRLVPDCRHSGRN